VNLNFNLLREKEMSKVFSLTENLEKGDVIVFTANGSINRNDELIMGSGIAARVKQRFVTVNGEEISLVFGKLVGHFGNRPFIVPCIDKKTDRRVLVASLPVKPETTPRSRVKKEELLPKYRDDLKREPFIQGWKFRVKPEILRENLEILVKELNSLVLEGKVLIPLVDCKKSELDEGEILEIYDEYLSKLRYKAVLFTKEGIVKEYEGGAPLSREEKLLLSLKGATGSLTIRLKTEEKLPLSLVDGVMTKSSLSSPEYVLDWVVHRYDLLGGEFQGEKGHPGDHQKGEEKGEGSQYPQVVQRRCPSGKTLPGDKRQRGEEKSCGRGGQSGERGLLARIDIEPGQPQPCRSHEKSRGEQQKKRRLRKSISQGDPSAGIGHHPVKDESRCHTETDKIGK